MNKNKNACFSSKTDDWRTPSKEHKKILDKGFIDLFPFQATFNQFDIDYKEKKLFINPPFSKMDQVAEYVIKQLKNHNEIILLIPTRTDTKYMQILFETVPSIYFIKGRLHYNDSKSAPFPSMILYWDMRKLVNFNFPFWHYGTFNQFIDNITEE